MTAGAAQGRGQDDANAPDLPPPARLSWRSGDRWRLGAGILLLLGLALAVHALVGWARVLGAWGAVSLPGLGVALALGAAGYLARGARVHRHFHPATRGRYGDGVRLVALNTFFNHLVPMRLGEMSFPWLLHRWFGVPAGAGVGALLWLRALDFHALGLLALLGLGLYRGPAELVVPAALLWAALPWAGYRFHARWLPRLESLPPARWSRALVALARGMPADGRTFRSDCAWTAAAWGLKLGVMAWLLLELGAPTPDGALAGALGGELTSVLPIHGVAGAGTYEAGVVAGLSLASPGLPLAASLAAAVNVHLFLLGLSALAALAAGAGTRRRPRDLR